MMLFALSMTASAMPFGGCTFLKDRLRRHSWPGGMDSGCANYHVETQACTKTKYVGGAVVTYQGDLVSGRSPEYLIEVTPHFGKSVFARAVDGQHLQVQMTAAEQWWKAQKGIPAFTPGMLLGGATQATNTGIEETQLLHARALRTPYGTLTWAWPDLGVIHSGAVAAPLCYLGISENSPRVWSDAPGHAETLVSGVMNGLPLNGCRIPGVAQLNNRIDPPSLRPVEACSVPVGRAQITAGMLLPDSEVADALVNPMLSCAGRHGPLFPRNGWVNSGSDELTNAQKVAYKFASLSRDHFASGPGIEAGDRWQIVWPPSANPLGGRCFVPGAERPLVEMLPGVQLPQLPGMDGATQRPRTTMEGSSNLIVGVWRKWSKCVEPGQGAIWQAYMPIAREIRVNACRVSPLVGP